ncbi:MAG: 3'-5' exonuclease [Pleomorphochaeta sp.]
MHEYILIDSDTKLEELINYFINNKLTTIAMDFEGEFNLHIYGEHLCLIQLFDTKDYYIIDPFEVSQEKLKLFLENKKIEKIMFSCDSDSSLVKKQFNIQIKNIFDVRILALDLDFDKGYSACVDKYLNINIGNKSSKKKNQMTNWLKRPLRDTQIQYALEDVAYLHQLKKVLIELSKKEDTYNQSMRKMKRAGIITKEPKPGWIKITNWKRLSKENKIYLKHFFIARDIVAKKMNVPAVRILEKKKLVTLLSVYQDEAKLKETIKNKNYKIERMLYPLMKKAIEDAKKEIRAKG